jgi:hypothetical protein
VIHHPTCQTEESYICLFILFRFRETTFVHTMLKCQCKTNFVVRSAILRSSVGMVKFLKPTGAFCCWKGDPMCGPPHLHRNHYQLIVGMINIFPTIILYNHVMHDDISGHDISKTHLVPKSSRPPHNSKLSLQNPKCFLYIFPSRRLFSVKLGLFLTSWLTNWLHKCLPPWIYAVGEEVAIVIVVAICFKHHRWTFSHCKSCH